jgi:23S rRNA pseudouridine1911/1915/1917 synthase
VFGASDAGRRLDVALAAQLADVSRSRTQALIEAGAVRLDGQPARAAHRLVGGEVADVDLPEAAPVDVEPEPIPLRVVYEDADVLVVDKPAGLVVHPAPGHRSGTLVNALLAHSPELAEGPREWAIGGELRPGIVHRLDKDTSGLLVVAKNERAHHLLADQLRARTMDKRYLALVERTPDTLQGTIDSPVGRHPQRPREMAVVATGRAAVTHFRVLRRYERHTLLECRPVTGRTHQIRVHLAAIGCPIAADQVYGRKQRTLPLDRQFLHAAQLTFRLPSGEQRTFDSPLPPDLQVALDSLPPAA